MADEMTPAEMRKRAEVLRKLGRAVSYYGVLGAVGLNDADRVSWARTFVAGADALDRLADVIEYAETDSHQIGMSDGYAEAMRDTLRLARGEVCDEPRGAGGAMSDRPDLHEESHDAWDAGGYCNQLVVDYDGSGTVCGYREKSDQQPYTRGVIRNG